MFVEQTWMAFENVIVKCLLCLQIRTFQYFSIPKKLPSLFKLKSVSCNIYTSVIVRQQNNTQVRTKRLHRKYKELRHPKPDSISCFYQCWVVLYFYGEPLVRVLRNNYLTVSVPVPHIIEISNLISGLVLPKRKSTPNFNLVVANLGPGSGS